MWFEIWKGRKKFTKKRIRTRVYRVKRSMTRFTICTTEADDNQPSVVMLASPITRWWAELVWIASAYKASYLHLV